MKSCMIVSVLVLCTTTAFAQLRGMKPEREPKWDEKCAEGDGTKKRGFFGIYEDVRILADCVPEKDRDKTAIEGRKKLVDQLVEDPEWDKTVSTSNYELWLHESGGYESTKDCMKVLRKDTIEALNWAEYFTLTHVPGYSTWSLSTVTCIIDGRRTDKNQS